MGVAAPVIVAEMSEWVALGGGNSGIVGDPNHQYGFHLGANEVPASDYSRWRDPNGSDGPYVDWRYACAGDFRHGGRADLRAMHANVLARLMRGDLPMICEFIGQPWSDRPVYYWARWNGVTTLQRYTGAGHDLWSHISWYRSMVDQRAYLWTAAPSPTQEEDVIYARTNANATVWASNGVERRPVSRLDSIIGGEAAIRFVADDAALTDLCGPPYKAPTSLTETQVRKIVAEELAKLQVPPVQVDQASIVTGVVTALQSASGQSALVTAANKAEDS